MREDSILGYDLEQLKIAAKEARRNQSQSIINNENRTDIVHAGYRLLQCASAAIIIIYHVTSELTENLPDIWNMTFMGLYPTCFFASLILAITRIMNVIPNPRPIIPVTISVIGWAAMLIGAIMSMRHAMMELHIESMTDDEVAGDPIFRHDLLICGFSLLGSSLYLVHAWLCYDCWRWEKRERKMGEAANSSRISVTPTSITSSESESDSGMSSNSETERNYDPGLPGTSDGQSGKSPGGRASRIFNKLKKKSSKMKPDQNDPLTMLNEILQSSSVIKQIVSINF